MLKNFVKRFLNLHEYQASKLLTSYNVPVLSGDATNNLDDAFKIAKNIESRKNNIGIVLKAQVHAGGRGRGYFKNSNLQGGVHILNNSKEVKEHAEKMLNDILITKQTGKEGKPCNFVYMVEKVKMKKEMYLSIMLNRNIAKPMIICSPKGGMGIEEIGKEFIFSYEIDPIEGINKNQIDKITNDLEIEGEENINIMKKAIQGLYKCFKENDSTLIEINPFALTEDNRLLVCDSKVNIDDNAKFRLKNLFEMEDLSQKDPKEIKAEQFDLNYIKLNGEIGCLVNGAGLAMATMDLIKYYGGNPANFLDVGGGSTSDRVIEAMNIINDDSDVKAIFVNIFGGIVRCDMIMEGIIKAMNQKGINKPIVCRINGTNADKAEKMIKESNLKIYWINDLDEAAKKIIELEKSI